MNLQEKLTYNRKQIVYLTSNGNCCNDIVKRLGRIKTHCHLFLGDSKLDGKTSLKVLDECQRNFYSAPNIIQLKNKTDEEIKKSLNLIKKAEVLFLHKSTPNEIWKDINNYELIKYIKRSPVLVGISLSSLVTMKKGILIPGSKINEENLEANFLGHIDFSFDVHFNKMIENEVWVNNAKNLLPMTSRDTYFLTDGSFIVFIKGKEKTVVGRVYKHINGNWFLNINGKFRPMNSPFSKEN